MAIQQLPHMHDQTLEAHPERIPDSERFGIAAEIFQQLSDPTRLRIFWILCHCEECVANLAALMDMSSPAVAHHLRLLKTAGLIESRKGGREVYYRAVQSVVPQELHVIMERIMAISCPDPGARE